MKKKYIGLIFIGLSLLLVAVSCASAPPPEGPPTTGEDPSRITGAQVPGTQEPLTGQAALDALNAAAARAAEARRRAADFDGQALFPSDWDSAQTLFDQAERQRSTSSPQDIQDSTGRYNRAAEAFDSLFERSLAEYFERVQRELAAAREAAIAAGARELTPEFLADADSTAARSQRERDAGNYDAARNSALEAMAMYNAMRTVLEANRLRAELSDRGLEAYDPDNVRSGNAALEAALAASQNRNFNEASNRGEEALAHLSAALITAWRTRAEQGRAAAAEERQKALDLRANVAAREEFDPAEAIYNRANTALSRENFEEAALSYDECRPMFTASAQLAMARRQAAQDALDRADRRLIESEETALVAEQILEGGAE